MAITKTTTVLQLHVLPAEDSSAEDSNNAKHPRVEVTYQEAFDDPEDSTLPATTTRYVYLTKFVENGGAATDYSGEAQLVQDVCGGIWS